MSSAGQRVSPTSHGRQTFTSTNTSTSTNTRRVSTSENSVTQACYQIFLDSAGMVGLQEEQVERFVKHLRASARVDYGQRITLESLSPEYYMTFARALSNVLSTEVALLSFAQIIDGLPITDVAWDIRGNSLYGDHPLDEHEDLCPGAMDKARELQKMWDPSTLKFNPKLVRAYRNASEGSKSFNTRLIELVAVAVHQLAAQVFDMKFRLHEGDIDSIANWVMPKPPDWKIGWFDIPPRPTLFNHPGYLDYEIYPEGEADMAGYWAEDRILGGAVAFDRRGEETSPSAPPNVYFLACRVRVTNHIYQLRDVQQDALLEFLRAEANTPPPEPCPLPIIADGQNHVRIDVFEAIMHHRVYRDIWEHRPWSMDEVNHFRRRPKEEVDYPEARQLVEIANSFPLSADRIEFSSTDKPHNSLIEDVDLSTSRRKNAGGNGGEHASGPSEESK